MALRGGPIRSSESAETVPGWRVEDFHRLLTHFFSEGVVQDVGDELEVVERGAGANMSVDVGSGLALIEVTTTLLNPNATLKTWLHNDETINVPVPTADSTHPRKDRIVAKFDMTIDPNGAASDNVSIELIQGTPAGSPTAPATPSNAVSLAVVDVPASDTSIESGQITDDRDFVELDAAVLKDVARKADVDSDIADLQDDEPTWLGTITGTDTLTGTATPTRTAHVEGQRFAFIVANNNTGAVTLNIDGLGAKAVVTNDGTALTSDDIITGQLVEVRYNGTQFVMTSPSAGAVTSTVDAKMVTTTDSNQAGASSTNEVDVNQNYTIPSADMVAGVTYRLEAWGFYRAEGGGTTATVRLKLGSSTLATVVATSASSDQSMYLRATITVRSTGETGSVIGALHFQFFTNVFIDANVSAATIDTTTDQVLKISNQMSANDARNGVKFNQMHITRLEPA